jgi:hypothetical protein
MPQLDVYIICNMLYNVILVFIAAYMLNISNLLIVINLILRIRRLKLSLDKNYIYNILKESLIKCNLRYYRYIFNMQLIKFELIKKYFIQKDLLDTSTLKKVL